MEKFIIRLVVSFCLFLNLATYAPPVSFYLDIVTNLQGYLLVFQILIILFLLLRIITNKQKKFLFSLILLILLSIRILADIKNFFLFPDAQTTNHKTADLNIYFGRINSVNRINELEQQINQAKANVVILKVEGLKLKEQILKNINKSTDWIVKDFQKSDSQIVLLSKLPLEILIQNFNQRRDLPNYFQAKVRLTNNQFGNILFFNALNPLIEDNFHLNKAYCRRLATIVKNNQEPNVVVGSFLATPFSQCYRWFASEKRETTDSFWGKGFVYTWDALNPLINLKLDHIFYNKFWERIDTSIYPSLNDHHLSQSVSLAFDQSVSNSSLLKEDKS